MTSSQIEKLSNKAEKFLNALNAEIAIGWTGRGQTNRLLGRITMRAYIFGHILGASEPLKGDALVGHVMETARSLPGFTLWCRHQTDLEAKVKDWVRCIEASHYFPYGEQFEKYKFKDDRQEQILDQQISYTRRLLLLLRKNLSKALSLKIYSLTFHQRQAMLVKLTPVDYRCMLVEHLNRRCKKLNNQEWALLITIWEFRHLIARAAWSEVPQMVRNHSGQYTYFSFTGQLLGALPEEYVAEITALQQHMKTEGKSDWYIRLRSLQETLGLMFALSVQIPLDNLLLPGRNRKIDDDQWS